jgi:hypothetical protein
LICGSSKLTVTKEASLPARPNTVTFDNILDQRILPLSRTASRVLADFRAVRAGCVVMLKPTGRHIYKDLLGGEHLTAFNCSKVSKHVTFHSKLGEHSVGDEETIR